MDASSLLLRTALGLLLLSSTAACSSGGSLGNDGESASKRTSAFKSTTTMVGDWRDLPSGYQCYVGMYYFYQKHFGVTMPYAPETQVGDCAPEGACHLWLDGQPSADAWDRHENGDGEPTTYDMIVYPPVTGNAYGHVAGVDHVENGLIYVMDDNFVADLAKSESPHTVGTTPYGWYHLRSAPLDPGQVGACSGLGDGLYCGGNGVSGDAGTLFRCISGNLSTAKVCDQGCKVMPPGTDDQCETGGTTTNACAQLTDGNYCGGDGVSGDAATLYTCKNGALTTQISCPSGCKVNPPGTDDACKTGTTTGGCSGKADGLYCGGDVGADAGTLYKCTGGALTTQQVCTNGCSAGACKGTTTGVTCAGLVNGLYCGNDGPGGDANTLYKCTSGTASVQQVCANGCQIMPSGTDDACKTGGTTGPSCTGLASGLYCGNDGVNGDANTLYKCNGGAISVQQVCANGCQVMPAGTNDACKSGGGSTATCAGLGNGLYCGNDGVTNGNAGTLYQCTNGAASVSQVCPNGCKINPPGTPDACN
jgi:hypothetical protein